MKSLLRAKLVEMEHDNEAWKEKSHFWRGESDAHQRLENHFKSKLLASEARAMKMEKAFDKYGRHLRDVCSFYIEDGKECGCGFDKVFTSKSELAEDLERVNKALILGLESLDDCMGSPDEGTTLYLAKDKMKKSLFLLSKWLPGGKE